MQCEYQCVQKAEPATISVSFARLLMRINVHATLTEYIEGCGSGLRERKTNARVEGGVGTLDEAMVVGRGRARKLGEALGRLNDALFSVSRGPLGLDAF